MMLMMMMEMLRSEWKQFVLLVLLLFGNEEETKKVQAPGTYIYGSFFNVYTIKIGACKKFFKGAHEMLHFKFLLIIIELYTE